MFLLKIPLPLLVKFIVGQGSVAWNKNVNLGAGFIMIVLVNKLHPCQLRTPGHRLDVDGPLNENGIALVLKALRLRMVVRGQQHY